MENTDLEQTGTRQQQVRSEKKKTIILTLVISFFLIGGIGTWGYYMFFGPKSALDVDMPSNEEVMEAEKASGIEIYNPTIEVPVTTIQQRINDMHEYWNSALGYDAWQSYKVTSHKQELQGTINNIREDLLPYVNGPLKKDMENAITKIESSIESNNVDPLKGVHRIFHDLDVILNGYGQTTEYWEVTETHNWYEKAKKQ